MFLAAGAAACLVAGSATHAWTALYTANALGLLALLWIALDARFAYTPLALVIVVALAPRLIAVFADPLFEDDWYRYLWDGLTSLASGDPYRLPPAAAFGDATLSPAQQALLSGINHPELPTIYGPALQALFTAAAWIAPAELWPLKAMLLAVDLATLALLTHLGVQTRWLLVYAVHPLIARETLANAHPDGLVGLLLLATLVAWRARYAVGVGICFGAALATKVAALVVLPLLMREPHARRPGLWIITLGLTATASVSLLYLPFLAGGTDLASLAVFAREWRFNPLGFRLVEALVPAPWARPSAAALVVMGVAALASRWRRDTTPPLDLALILLLFFAPALNPWYWLWVLPLAVAVRRVTGVVGAAVAALSYTNSSVLFEAGLANAPDSPFAVSWPLAAVQLIALTVAFLVDVQRGYNRSRSTST